MHRRNFLQLAAAAPAIGGTATKDEPSYRIVSKYTPQPGMPGRFPGSVVRVHAEKCIDITTERVDAPTVRAMLSQGMRRLTGLPNDGAAWRSFFEPSDVVGIKLNCSGAPGIMSTPELISGIVDSLIMIGVPAQQIWLYERFPSQVNSVHYDRYVPAGVHIHSVEESRGSILNYDPKTYVEVDFFGEDDTRSNMVRLIPEKLTKIINVPNMKDHGAAGVTGCLKNIAYGSFSNVARSHFHEKTNTLSFIGTLASVEPLRSKTVLNIMDGLRGIWHGGPFSKDMKFHFYPKQIAFGTDPVALDRLLIDIIDDERRRHDAVSVWDRSTKNIRARGGELDPNVNRFIREPGHIEYASKLSLGVYDIAKMHIQDVQV